MKREKETRPPSWMGGALLKRGLSRRFVLGALAMLGAGGAATAKARENAAARKRPVTLLENAFLAGMGYYDFGEGPRGVRPGQRVLLRRQPDNPYDALAIEVLMPDGRKLGYVARQENEALARLMDAGVEVRATLVTVGEDVYSVTMRIEALLRA